MIHSDPHSKWRRFKFVVNKDVDESEYYLSHRNERHSNPAFAQCPFYGYIRRDRVEILDLVVRSTALDFANAVEIVHGYTIETLVRDYEAEGYKDVGGFGTTDYLERLVRRGAIESAAAVVSGQIPTDKWGKVGDTDRQALKIIDPNGNDLLPKN